MCGGWPVYTIDCIFRRPATCSRDLFGFNSLQKVCVLIKIYGSCERVAGRSGSDNEMSTAL